MVNGMQLYQQYRSNDQDMALRQEASARQAESHGLQNQMMRFQFAQAQEQAGRERQRQNMLAQAMQSGNPNALMMADPKLGMQMQQMRSREQMMRDRMGSQERMAQDRNNQPIWDAQRGVFIQRPQAGMMPPGAGVITPPNLPAPRNPEAEKLQAKAAAGLPDALNQGQMAIQQIDEMIGSEKPDPKTGKVTPEHAGFQNAVGAPKIMGIPDILTGIPTRVAPSMFPGSDTSNFLQRLKQIQGGAFLQAFESLKGGGQITVIEGEKATQAITRLSQAQSEKEFSTAARELQDILRRGMENAKKQAAPIARSGAQAPQDNDPLGFRQ